MEAINRKRLRSDDSPIILQSKIFVNQRTANLTDEAKMKQIYNKTISMLFKGAKRFNSNDSTVDCVINDIVTLSGNGKVEYQRKEKPQGFPTTKSKSKCCNKEALILSDCSNCNLGLCEFCAYSCTGCKKFLCQNCIILFGCGTLEEPLCESCLVFNS